MDKNKIKKWSGPTVLVVLVAIQFIPVDRENPPVESEIVAPNDVMAVLRSACYNCHSNETVWPWYSHVAPVSWLVASDVEEGRAELNFSAWGRLTPEREAKKMKEIWEEVEEGEMPPKIYLISHSEARLSEANVATLKAWTMAGRGDHGDDDSDDGNNGNDND